MFEGQNFSIANAAFNPLGNTLATLGSDGALQIWDVSNPSAPHVVAGPVESNILGEAGVSLVFSPDGKMLAAGGDFNIRLWDVSDPAIPRPLGAPFERRGARLLFSPDGKTLLSQGDDLILWPIAPEVWIEQACRLAGRNLAQIEWQQYVGQTPYHKTCAQWPDGE